MKKIYISFADDDIAAYKATFAKLAEVETHNTLQTLDANPEKIKDADIIIALISPDYLWSEKLHKIEAALITHYVEAGTLFIPLILSNCMWDMLPFMTWRDLPPPYADPVDEWENPQAALDKFISQLKDIIDETPPLRAYG